MPADAAPRGLLDRILDWRNRLLASGAVQRRLAAFPLTRPVANARARALFDLTAGFVYSQVLSATVKLDLLPMLADGPRTPGQVALAAGLPVTSAERLLEAAEGIGLLARRGRGEGGVRYGLGELGAALLGNPGAMAMIRHHDMLYRDLADPVALLRGETEPETGRFWAYVRNPSGLGADEAGPYSELMAVSQDFIAEDVLDALPLGRFGTLLDIGGGEGAFLIRAAARAPGLTLRLFDLPAVAERARSRFAEAGLAGRAEARGGDFFRDPLPEVADAVSLVRVIYDHGDEAAALLLSRARAALPPGGTLILAEPMAGDGGKGRVGAYFSLYLLAMGSGRSRSAAELAELVRTAGFHDIRRHRTPRPDLVGLITARA